MSQERYGTPDPNDLVAGRLAPEENDPARSTGVRTEGRNQGYTQGQSGDTGQGQAQKVIERADAGRERAAEGMHTAAEQVREKAEQLPGGERTGQIAHKAADTMESAAGYMREHDVNEMASDLQQIVRDHPREALIAAAAVGFLVGRAMRS
jgi:ElaB/YqjD/DUF883 family membrane-anchored ribosome-binding protein